MGSLAERHYANLGATVTAASVGAEGVAAGHTRAWAPSALKAGRGWWPALVSALPHVKPHLGIGGDQKGEGCSRRGLGPPSRTQEA